jgi:hypothetical protein
MIAVHCRVKDRGPERIREKWDSLEKWENGKWGQPELRDLISRIQSTHRLRRGIREFCSLFSE